MRSEAILTDRIQSEIAQRRIVCADDNLLELTLLGKILELQGHAVVLLSYPIQALRCDLSTFDLAILDFEMPGMNGKDIAVYLGQDTSVTIQYESLPWVRKFNMLKPPMTASLLRTSGSHIDAQMKAMGQIYQSLQQQAAS